jgi:hypothetical protein
MVGFLRYRLPPDNAEIETDGMASTQRELHYLQPNCGRGGEAKCPPRPEAASCAKTHNLRQPSWSSGRAPSEAYCGLNAHHVGAVSQLSHGKAARQVKRIHARQDLPAASQPASQCAAG